MCFTSDITCMLLINNYLSIKKFDVMQYWYLSDNSKYTMDKKEMRILIDGDIMIIICCQSILRQGSNKVLEIPQDYVYVCIFKNDMKWEIRAGDYYDK